MSTTIEETSAPHSPVSAPEIGAVEVEPVTEADVLHRAADLLEEFGWQQGGYGSKEDGKFCALGALDEAAVELGTAIDGFGVISARYERILGLDGIPSWNDAKGRTKAEVVAALREAAERSTA